MIKSSFLTAKKSLRIRPYMLCLVPGIPSFLISAFPVHSATFFPNPLFHLSLCWVWLARISVWFRGVGGGDVSRCSLSKVTDADSRAENPRNTYSCRTCVIVYHTSESDFFLWFDKLCFGPFPFEQTFLATSRRTRLKCQY